MTLRSRRPARIRVEVNFSAYPLRASLGALGRKWALLVLMNIALSRAQRFNELLRSVPGMSKRILAMRLADLERDGFIHRAEKATRFTRWELTQKGADVLPVLLTLIHFGSRWGPPANGAGDAAETLGRRFEVTYGSTAPERAAPRSLKPASPRRKSRGRSR